MTDLDIIAQLEQRIGRKLEKLDEISWESVGYQFNENNQVIGLGLQNCKLTELPTEITQLQNLQDLKINYNQLRTLPPEIGQLQNLQGLGLNSNQLSSLPPEIGQLQNLQFLSLYSNQLSTLPPEIGQLQNLQGLSLDSNQLRTLPPEIAQLQNLQHLDLGNNPLETPPREIIDRGLDAIREYLKPLRHAHALNELKAIFVGDGASGKTSLIKQLFDEPFDKHESQTHGILIRDWLFSTEQVQDVKAHLWDFGGQEIMHATHQFFLSKRSLYLLILDGRKDEKTEYWLQHIESFGGKSPTLIILNKMDENPGFDVNRKFLKEKYPFIIDFHRVSCKTKSGIAKLKSAIQQAALQVEILKTLWSSAWLAVKIALENKNQAQVDFIPYDTYVELCRQENVSEQKSQQVLVTFLHDLGIVIYFNDLGLEETSVINPRWVTQAVYDIITSKVLAKQEGVIKRSEIEPLLNPQTHPRHKHSYIIELMKKFELCYELDDKQTILIPDLLPVEEPNFDFSTENAIRFILQYKFLPKSIIAKFIVKMHRDIKQQLRWRTGVVLENQRFKAAAVVKADEEAKKIFIDVNGQQKREYFAALLYMFRDIHQIFAKMDVVELIRLPDNPNETVSYKKLVSLEQRREKYYQGDEKNYPVSELLGAVRSENPTLEMMTVLHKLSDQMLTQEEFLKKIEYFFKEQTSRGELSEETAMELGLGTISAIFGVDPHRFWKNLKEIRDRAWRIV